jgi:predicted acyltransferase
MQQQRYLALDIFRGMTVCFMIIVNTGGDGAHTFAPLLHAKWHGFTPTDLVFPSFLFAVGNALSFVALKWSSMSQSQVISKIFKRTLIVFLLGYLMYWFPFFRENADGQWVFKPISETRILGVLQRIALCYGAAALMVYYLKPKWIVALSLLFLAGYSIVLTNFGDLTREGNIGSAFDLWLMGDKHLYHGEGVPFDPEGWLSTIPSIVNVIFGYFAGKYIQEKGKSYEGLTHLLLTGFALLTLAYFWDSSLPINKKLWTSSFTLYTVGLDLIILSTVIYLVDIKGHSKWGNFFEVFGKNTITIYLLSEIGITALSLIPIGDGNFLSWIYEHIFSLAPLYWASLLFALWWMLTCWLVGKWMDNKKIYIKV